MSLAHSLDPHPSQVNHIYVAQTSKFMALTLFNATYFHNSNYFLLIKLYSLNMVINKIWENNCLFLINDYIVSKPK